MPLRDPIDLNFISGFDLAASDNTNIEVRRAYERIFSAGETVFEEGEVGNVLFIIQAGEIELSRRALGGRRVVAKLGCGEFFGEMSVVVGDPRTARANAVCDTRLLEIDGATLEVMCIEQPEIAIRIIRRLTARLIDSERRLSALGVDDLLGPIVRALLKRADPKTEDGVRFPGNLSEFAREAGLSMLEAHHALHQLLDQRTLRLVDDCLIATDIDSVAAHLDHA